MRLAEVGIGLHEFRCDTAEVPVMPSRSWITRTCASQSGPAPMPMVGIVISRVTCAARSRGIPSRTSAKAPGVLEGLRIGEEALAITRAPGLDPQTTECVDRLRGQPEVSHHRDPPLGQVRDRVHRPPAALELHRMHPCLEEEDGILDGVGAGALVGAEGQVADQQLLGAPRATARAWWSISVIVTGRVLG